MDFAATPFRQRRPFFTVRRSVAAAPGAARSLPRRGTRAAFLHHAEAAADHALHRFARLRIMRERRVFHALLPLEAAALRAGGLVNIRGHAAKLDEANGLSKLAGIQLRGAAAL